MMTTIKVTLCDTTETGTRYWYETRNNRICVEVEDNTNKVVDMCDVYGGEEVMGTLKTRVVNSVLEFHNELQKY